jgi:small membrane protein
MIIKILLISAILVLIVWFLSNRTTHQVRAWQKIGVILLTLIGAGVVISPDSSNRIAHKLGVGRGADLLLYLLTVSFIFMTLSLYLKNKEEERRIVVLARKIALLESRLSDRNK